MVDIGGGGCDRYPFFMPTNLVRRDLPDGVERAGKARLEVSAELCCRVAVGREQQFVIFASADGIFACGSLGYGDGCKVEVEADM